MALFKVSKGLKANLPSAKTEGYCWYTTDDSLFYIDYKDENGSLQRKALNAKDAETLTGASLSTILNSSDVEIPTSKAVLNALNEKLDKADAGSDWNQNDNTKPDYVKNRPFYTGDPVEIVMLPETTITIAEGENLVSSSFTYSFEVGQTYVITFDGVDTEYTAYTFNDSPVLIGYDYSSVVGGSGYAVAVFDGPLVLMTMDESLLGSHTIAIKEYAQEIVKIDEKYLPYDIAKQSDLATIESNLNTNINDLNASISNLNTLVGSSSVSTQINTAALDNQSDWSVNNTGSAAYIKNRTHYATLTTFINNKTYNFTKDTYTNIYYYKFDTDTEPFKPTEGVTYIVTWDGTTYECDANSNNGIGDKYQYGGASSATTGEPFYITYNDYQKKLIINTRNTASSHTITISSENVTQLDEKFIPNTIARIEDLPASASDIDAVPTSRTVNGKALSANITLSASDVSALPSSTTYVSTVDGSSGAVTTNAVKYTAQTLTDAQKTQARTNIDAQQKLYNLVLEDPIVSNIYINENESYTFPTAITLSASYSERYYLKIDIYNFGKYHIYEFVGIPVGDGSGSYYILFDGGNILVTSTEIKNTRYDHVRVITLCKVSEFSNQTDYGIASTNSSSFAQGVYSYAEGYENVVIGNYSHAEGYNNVVIGNSSHAEGYRVVTSGNSSHAEGYGTKVSGDYSHAEGCSTTASGDYSHAEGYKTTASGNYSHTEGNYTNASSENQHVQGKYNVEDSSGTYAHIVGNGTDDTARSNAHTLDWSGNAWYAGTVEGKALILPSSTENSTKKFKITVNDDYNVSATNTSDSVSKTLATTEYVDNSVSNPLNITSATVGQIAKISAVDDTGKPTTWETINIPTPFKPEGKSYLTFSSPNSFTLAVNDTTKHWDGTIEYFASNKTWTVWAGTTTLSAVDNDGEYVLYLRGTGNTKITGLTADGPSDTYRWVLTGSDIACAGNIENLLDYATVESGQHPTMAEACYGYMFQGCTGLTKAPALPATTLESNCYRSMFSGCASLTKAPALPATTLANYCYYQMFQSCTSLIQAPALPATTLVDYCYYQMFEGCTSLTQAPALPATTLAGNCYFYMFFGCTGLTQAPALPATTLTEACYFSMFQNCTALTQAPALPATTLATNCYAGMFQNCTSLTQAPALPATTLKYQCYAYMFRGCTSLTQAPTLSATTLADRCYYFMFLNCTSLTQAPALPATMLANYCYNSMFRGCTSLKLSSSKTGEYTQEYRTTSSGTGTTATDALTDMFTSTGGTFTGTPSINTTYYLSSDNMIVHETDVSTLNGYVGSMIDVAIGNAIGGSY